MTLTIQDLGALGEFFGSIAVLATLIYLALQTRQNTAAIGAQLDAARIDAILTINLAAATSNELQEALNEDRVDPAPISRTRLSTFWGTQFLNFQWQFQQARRGYLPTFSEAGLGSAVGGMFRVFRSVEGWWEGTKLGFDSDFVEWVEEQRSKAA